MADRSEGHRDVVMKRIGWGRRWRIQHLYEPAVTTEEYAIAASYTLHDDIVWQEVGTLDADTHAANTPGEDRGADDGALVTAFDLKPRAAEVVASIDRNSEASNCAARDGEDLRCETRGLREDRKEQNEAQRRD